MDNVIYTLFGSGKDLTALQMSVRAFIMFFITLVLIRISGRRTLNKNSSLDMINVIVLGSIIARGIAGASSFGATVAASIVMVLIHRSLGWLTVKNRMIGKWINGTYIILYQDGKIIAPNLKKACMSKEDLYESLRLETKEQTLEKIDKAYMEKNGRISFTKK